MKLIILASGRGSRLTSLTDKIPKCLIKVSGESILSRFEKFFHLFKDVIIITGYKSSQIKNVMGDKVTIVKNSEYLKTNMVHSLFCASHLVNEDIIVSYSDIIFDPRILKNLMNKSNTTLPLNYSWYNIWKKRMSIKDLLKDAEDVEVKNNKIISIGGKISKNKIPKMQFMGLIKIKKRDFFKMKKKYYEIKNNKIDFTRFLDVLIKSETISLEYCKSKLSWIEIDTKDDLKVAEKITKKVNIK